MKCFVVWSPFNTVGSLTILRISLRRRAKNTNPPPTPILSFKNQGVRYAKPKKIILPQPAQRASLRYFFRLAP